MPPAPITQEQLEAIATHRVAEHVERFRGPHVPWPVAMVMAEHEDPSFSPLVYNYYRTDAQGNKTAALGIAYASPGSPPCARWARSGDAGCAHDPHACGQYQILDSIRLAQGGYGGVKLPYLNDLFDPEKNIQAALAGRSADAGRLIAWGVEDPTLLALLLYLSHAEGIGVLIGGRYEGALARLKRLAKALTWVNLCALPWGEAGWWTIHNHLSGVAAAVARMPLWVAAESALKQGGAADELPQAEPDVRPHCDALIAEVQAAEMLRDLPRAAELRAQLEALVAPLSEDDYVAVVADGKDA